ncbi:MAG: hypothetical protein J1F36_06615 [Clostridiales bacterium]|nr:hypothetical protein [Clostridiales bacterium]
MIARYGLQDKEITMEEQEQKTGKCFHCGGFKRFYTKESTYFDPCKIGYCLKQDKLVNAQDSCVKWHKICKKSRQKQIATRILKELLLKISAIKQILEEAQNEEIIIKENDYVN